MRRICLSVTLVLLIILAVSCGSEVFNSDEEVLSDITPERITFTDSFSRPVTVEKKPKRVVCLTGSFAEIWMLSGGEVVGAAEDAWQDFDLELGSDTVSTGGAHSPNLEIILSARPDFVIASGATASHVELMSALEKSGTPVAYFDIDCFDDYLSVLDICTDITGRKDLYNENGTKIKEEIERIKEDFADLSLGMDEKKILLLRASSSSVKAKGSDGTVIGEMLCDLGCINIADSDKSLLENLSVEKVITESPYRIFIVTMGNDESASRENISELITKNPSWAGLDAVKKGRLHFMEKRLFNIKPNARWAEAYEILKEIFENQ